MCEVLNISQKLNKYRSVYLRFSFVIASSHDSSDSSCDPLKGGATLISYSSKNVAMHRRISINNLIVISRKISITWVILVQNDYFYLYFHDKN